MEANYNQDYYSSRNMMIIKGKRTKRPRPSSPISLTMASTSSTTTTTTEDGDHTQKPNNNTFHTMNGSIEFTKILQENDEEDMANCLILLAHSQSSPPPPPQSGAVDVPRISELHVFECKTCNREFPSFQALGGHRASHKKPSKPNMLKQDLHINHGSTELSLQIGSNQMDQCNNPSGLIKVAKVHECSISGAEFGSGQALGGHMRRHRSMSVATTVCDGSVGCQESKKPKTLLSLDLNLPAPVEDDIRGNEVQVSIRRSNDRVCEFFSCSLPYLKFETCYI